MSVDIKPSYICVCVCVCVCGMHWRSKRTYAQTICIARMLCRRSKQANDLRSNNFTPSNFTPSILKRSNLKAKQAEPSNLEAKLAKQNSALPHF